LLKEAKRRLREEVESLCNIIYRNKTNKTSEQQAKLTKKENEL
jgi:hypothetical protein